ncbi:hypothetical protein PR048_026873 [Dryococelus australis]|uniref:Uncharacterized protein n=1 Tax=Dryococelus australis TaxID=614101 RepID=A0ABQ9GMK2_9NEOP|nr:hypothetical protein PR048_026873 [Dryococelus australis]
MAYLSNTSCQTRRGVAENGRLATLSVSTLNAYALHCQGFRDMTYRPKYSSGHHFERLEEANRMTAYPIEGTRSSVWRVVACEFDSSPVAPDCRNKGYGRLFPCLAFYKFHLQRASATEESEVRAPPSAQPIGSLSQHASSQLDAMLEPRAARSHWHALQEHHRLYVQESELAYSVLVVLCIHIALSACKDDQICDILAYFSNTSTDSPGRRMGKVTRPMTMLILHKAEEHTTCIQVDLKQGFQKGSFYRKHTLGAFEIVSSTNQDFQHCSVARVQVGGENAMWYDDVDLSFSIVYFPMRMFEVRMEQRQNKGAGEAGRSLGKPADQRHCPARFSHTKFWSEQTNHSATAAPYTDVKQVPSHTPSGKRQAVRHAPSQLPASHPRRTGSIPGRVTSGFSNVGIVLDDAAGLRTRHCSLPELETNRKYGDFPYIVFTEPISVFRLHGLRFRMLSVHFRKSVRKYSEILKSVGGLIEPDMYQDAGPNEFLKTTLQSWTGDRDEVNFEQPKLVIRNLDPRSAAIVDKFLHWNQDQTGSWFGIRFIESRIGEKRLVSHDVFRKDVMSYMEYPNVPKVLFKKCEEEMDGLQTRWAGSTVRQFCYCSFAIDPRPYKACLIK